MPETPGTRASLLVRLRDPGDGIAWNRFVDLYTPLIYGFFRRHGLQDADAADLSQDVLARVAGADEIDVGADVLAAGQHTLAGAALDETEVVGG